MLTKFMSDILKIRLPDKKKIKFLQNIYKKCKKLPYLTNTIMFKLGQENFCYLTTTITLIRYF